MASAATDEKMVSALKSPMTELVIYPPPIHALPRLTKKGWDLNLRVETPAGMITGTVCVPHEVVEKAIHSDFATRLILAACHRIESSGEISGEIVGFDSYSGEIVGDDAGWGFHIPNPMKIVSHAAHGLMHAAHSAVSHAINLVPSAIRGPLDTALNAIKNAPGISQATAALASAQKLLGSVHLPGGIPLMALSPYGAAALAGSKLLGPGGADAAVKSATDMMSSLGDDVAADVIACTVGAIASSKAKTIATDPNFAKEVGIPTLKVQDQLRPAAREMIKLLRLAYVHDAEAKAKLDKLRHLAESGDKSARVLWFLAADISNAVHGVKRPAGRAPVHAAGAIFVGDGFGDGYGQAGWAPGGLPAHVLHVREAIP